MATSRILPSASSSRCLTYDEASSIYDRIGIWYERQDFYERAAINKLCRHASFDTASSVIELGCGTGKLATRLLEEELPSDARYLGLDVSNKMVTLTKEKTASFRSQVEVRRTDGRVRGLAIADESYDRFVTCYVLDLLSLEDIRGVFEEARRILKPDGLLCVASLTHGTTTLSKTISQAWTWVHSLDPRFVAGCRPIEVQNSLDLDSWSVEYCRKVVSYGITSEVVIARRRHR